MGPMNSTAWKNTLGTLPLQLQQWGDCWDKTTTAWWLMLNLEKHFNFRMVWEYLDVMMRLSGEGGRIRAAPLQSSLDYRNAHSRLPTLLVSNSDATEIFLWLRIHENRCLKLHLWHHARPSSACPAPIHYPRDRWTKIPHWPHAVAVLAGHVRHGYPSPSCTRKLPGKHGTCTGPTHLGLWHTTIAEAMHTVLVQLVQSVKDLHKLHRYLILGLVNCAKFEFHPSIKQHLAQINTFLLWPGQFIALLEPHLQRGCKCCAAILDVEIWAANWSNE